MPVQFASEALRVAFAVELNPDPTVRSAEVRVRSPAAASVSTAFIPGGGCLVFVCPQSFKLKAILTFSLSANNQRCGEYLLLDGSVAGAPSMKL